MLTAGFRLWSTGAPLYLTMLPVGDRDGAADRGRRVRLRAGSGIGAVALAAVVLVVFQYLVWARVQAYERGEELAQARRASSRRSRSAS